jgi:hypothetical protein
VVKPEEETAKTKKHEPAAEAVAE